MFKSLILGFLGGFLCLLILEFYIFSILKSLLIDFYLVFVANVITYSALGYCYFHFINWGETSRRIRILRELYESDNGLTFAEILERYNAKEIIQVRFLRLLANGQIIIKDGSLFIGKKTVLLIAKIVVFLKLLILGKKSEFD